MTATATVLPLPTTKQVKLQCSTCGAEGQASCDCGAPYLPAGKRAEAAVTANPEKSDRAIAEEAGVGKDTVRRARKTTGAPAPVRTGKDGKARRMPERVAVRLDDRDDVVEELSPAVEARDAPIMDVEQNLDQARVMAKQCQVLMSRMNKSKLKKIRSKIASTAAVWREVEIMAEQRLGNGT